MAKFEVFQDRAKKWRWRLVAGNGATVATSGESFASKANAIRAARRVKELAATASVPADPKTVATIKFGPR